MAFTTELVLPAQTGSGVELIQDAVTSGTSSTWSRSVTLPAGRWLVVVKCRSNFTNATSPTSEIIRIDGTDAIKWEPSYGATALYTPAGMQIVTGGRAITINATSGSNFSGQRGWDIYAARIPG